MRAQVSLSLVEAAVGVVLILAVAMGFVVRPAHPDHAAVQLDAYAEDAATVLAGEPPRHRGTTRLSEVARSPAAFERERDALDRRVDRILPDHLMYRVETPHGAVGYRVPAGVPVGRTAVATGAGTVTVRVWYV